ncbi:MAG: hypothetical protein CM1200mP28_01970 [Deltaproteobacteria bacterium]|nr:MAG: hypothetical protein CM1200mP28_01970 [Deltaproteobacteria bacterium]
MLVAGMRVEKLFELVNVHFIRIISWLAGIKKNAKFDFEIRHLPYWEGVKGAPQNTIFGGSSLWVLSGHSSKEYKGVAAFLSFLSSTVIQAAWHQNTGYLPVTLSASQKTKESGFYDSNPEQISLESK